MVQTFQGTLNEPSSYDYRNKLAENIEQAAGKQRAGGCLSYWTFLQRAIVKLYSSVPVAAPGGAQGQEPYVFTDPVPLDMWRVVLQATVNFRFDASLGVSNPNPFGLWLLPADTPSIALVPFNQVYNAALFRDDRSAAGGQNNQPPNYGIRIDTAPAVGAGGSTQGDNVPFNGPFGYEASCLARPLVMPPGTRLLAFEAVSGGSQNHPTNMQIELRTIAVDLYKTEDIGFNIW